MAKKIYVVDDNDGVRQMAVDLYKNRNYDAREFPDAVSALEAIAKGANPDLILMDSEMPGLMGYEACSKIKKDEATREIKIIGASGNTTDGYEQKWKEAGADGFIAKPFNLADLLNKTRELLGE